MSHRNEIPPGQKGPELANPPKLDKGTLGLSCPLHKNQQSRVQENPPAENQQVRSERNPSQCRHKHTSLTGTIILMNNKSDKGNC